jgi:hypothetical protein
MSFASLPASNRHPAGRSVRASFLAAVFCFVFVHHDALSASDHLVQPPRLKSLHHIPEMTSTEAPIGASVIDYIERNNASSSVDDNRPALETTDVSPQAAESASLPSAPPSLIACNKSCNVLLKGVPQSGLSSIAMNMAHSIASSSTQYCQGACGAGSTSSCTCVAVSILTPLSTNPTRESFPMSCHLVESSPPLDFYGQLRALQQQQENDASNNNNNTWNKAALRRIQVHRMATIRDVMEYLLNIQSNYPMGGIILQDLDVFVKGNSATSNANEELSTEQLMTMTQICK